MIIAQEKSPRACIGPGRSIVIVFGFLPALTGIDVVLVVGGEILDQLPKFRLWKSSRQFIEVFAGQTREERLSALRKQLVKQFPTRLGSVNRPRGSTPKLLQVVEIPVAEVNASEEAQSRLHSQVVGDGDDGTCGQVV